MIAVRILTVLFRICPGRHIAVNAMVIAIASVLAAFNIELASDEFGNSIPVEDDVTSGLISYVGGYVTYICLLIHRLDSPSLSNARSRHDDRMHLNSFETHWRRFGDK